MADPSLARDISAASSLSGQFLLRSGQLSSTYFDKYRFKAEPQLLARLAREMATLIPAGTEVLAGLELGGIPIVTAMSLQTGIRAAFVRKEAKAYGTCQAVEGSDVRGRRVLLVEDVISTGGAVSDAVKLMQRAGADVIGVVCAIWRGDGPPHIGAVPALPVFPALTKEDLEQV